MQQSTRHVAAWALRHLSQHQSTAVTTTWRPWQLLSALVYPQDVPSSCTASAAALTQVHSYSAARQDEPTRISYFQKQKAKALGTGSTAPEGQAPPTDAVVVQPSESKASLEQVSQVLSHPALIVTRPIEWGTVIFGYEQANRYTVYDQDGQPVAQLAEEFTGIGNELGRQLLRTRRSFTATVFSADGSQVIFKLRRPMYLINSTMLIEDGEGNTVGEVRQRWHPIKRNYDLYLDKQQFAAISGNFLAWEFELKDANGGTLALIDRNFQGFGKELFTDAGKYVIHFGMQPQQAADVATQTVQARSEGKAQHPVTAMALARTEVAVIPTVTGNQLAVTRPLRLDERMVVLAAAISIDYDFFSQHSRSGGWLTPPLILPMPMPGGAPTDVGTTAPGGPDAGAVPGAAAGGAASGAADSAFPSAGRPDAAPGQGGTDGEMHLGGDEFTPPPTEGNLGGGGAGDGELKWDIPSDSGGGGGGEGGGAGGILAMLWHLITGSDD